MRAGIYRIKNIINNTIYIGSSLDAKTRIRLHKWMLNRDQDHDNIHLQRAWNKYGKVNFRFRVIESIEISSDLSNKAVKKLILSKEQEWIDYYNSIGPLYNICPTAGNRLGTIQSEYQKKTLSDFHRGKEKSSSHRQNISKAKIGVPRSKESVEKQKQLLIEYFEMHPEKVSSRKPKAITNASGKRSQEAVDKFSANAKKQFAGKEGHAELVRRSLLGAEKIRRYTDKVYIDVQKFREEGATHKEISERFSIPMGSIPVMLKRKVA